MDEGIWKFFFFLSNCIRRSTSVDQVKGFFWFVLAVQGWPWGPPVPLESAVCWILNSTLSVPGFVFNIVQLQEGVQSIAAASFIGSGNKPEEIPSFSLITVLGFYWLGFLTHPTLRQKQHWSCFRCLRWIRRAQLPGSLSCLLPSLRSCPWVLACGSLLKTLIGGSIECVSSAWRLRGTRLVM